MLQRTLSLVLLMLPVPVLLNGQGRAPVRFNLEARLATIEERLDGIEDWLAEAETSNRQEHHADTLTSASEAKLDRLEVRVIQLENGPQDCGCSEVGDRSILDRLRSLERQIARLRSARIRSQLTPSRK